MVDFCFTIIFFALLSPLYTPGLGPFINILIILLIKKNISKIDSELVPQPGIFLGIGLKHVLSFS